MTQICINSHSSGRFTNEVINGRDHIVTTMRSIDLDSVMNGLFYPASEVTKAMGQLDMIPAPADHPNVDGQSVSAFHPLALNANSFGAFVRSPKIDGKKVLNDLVIDLEVAGRSEDGRTIVDNVKSGARMGVSTGLNAKILNNAGSFGGKEFRGTVSEIDFDHVAVLLSDRPAGDNTFTLNSSVLFHNLDRGKYLMDTLTLDLTNLSLEDRIKVSNLKLPDLMDAINHQVTVAEATDIVTNSGLQVNSLKVDQVNEFLENKDAFEAFKAVEQTKIDEMKDFIVANSKMTEDQLAKFTKDDLESFSNSVVPANNYSIANGPGKTAELALDLM